MQSQIENYRAKAKEFARLMIVAKSLRHSRQYRKLAEMYWALALGEESDRAQPLDAASVEVVALPSTFALNAVVSISRQRPFSPHLRFVG